jgi:hypothetical protein
MIPVHPMILDSPFVVWSLTLIGWSTFAIGILRWRELKRRMPDG